MQEKRANENIEEFNGNIFVRVWHFWHNVGVYNNEKGGVGGGWEEIREKGRHCDCRCHNCDDHDHG